MTAEESALTADQVIAMVVTRFPAGVENWIRVADLLVAEVERLREENDRLKTVSVARGSRVRFPDGTIIDRAETTALRARLARVDALPAKLDDVALKARVDGSVDAGDAYEEAATFLRDALRDE